MNTRISFGRVLLKFLLHTVFWIGVYFFYTYFLGYGSNNTEYIYLFSAFLMPVTIALSYISIYYLIPRYVLTKKYIQFIVYSVSTLIISIYVIVTSILFGLTYSSDLITDRISPITKTIPFIILGVYLVVLVVVSINLVMHNYKSIIKNEDLKNRILETQLKLKEQELNYLKSQIHPHFLFNTLNTLYGFAIKKANETPEMILKLSNLLDYLLYQSDKPFVLLSDEINHIEDYIELEKMRFHDTLNIKLNVSEYDNDIKIPPMLLIPFVENSFKHGKIIEGKLKIFINIEINQELLLFSVKNSSDPPNNNNNSHGIGLKNIKKRLQLLYKDNHTLKTENTANGFEVDLSLNYTKLSLDE